MLREVHLRAAIDGIGVQKHSSIGIDRAVLQLCLIPLSVPHERLQVLRAEAVETSSCATSCFKMDHHRVD